MLKLDSGTRNSLEEDPEEEHQTNQVQSFPQIRSFEEINKTSCKEI